MDTYYISVSLENISNGFNESSLDIITIAAILSGVFVIVSRNPIVSVLFLIGLFLSISLYLMILGINFIGISYVLVYVGAVSILFLFILMLINVRISEIYSTTNNNIPLGIIIGILFFSTVYRALPLSGEIINIKEVYQLNTLYAHIKNEIYKYYNNIYNLFNVSDKEAFTYSLTSNNGIKSDYIESPSEYLYLSYSQNWDTMLNENYHINTLGNILYTSFPLWILLTSLILLLAMVGAILITLKN